MLFWLMGEAALPHTFRCAVLLALLFAFIFVCYFCSDCAASDQCWYVFAVVHVVLFRTCSGFSSFLFRCARRLSSVFFFQVELLRLLESQQELTQ